MADHEGEGGAALHSEASPHGFVHSSGNSDMSGSTGLLYWSSLADSLRTVTCPSSPLPTATQASKAKVRKFFMGRKCAKDFYDYKLMTDLSSELNSVRVDLRIGEEAP